VYEVDPVFRHRDEEVRLHMYILIIFTCSKCSDDICECIVNCRIYHFY